MTTVTITDQEISFEGHAGDRDVCISLAALSQGLAAIVARSETKKSGEHCISYVGNDVFTVGAIVDGIAAHIASIAVAYPENVRLVDAR